MSKVTQPSVTERRLELGYLITRQEVLPPAHTVLPHKRRDGG